MKIFTDVQDRIRQAILDEAKEWVRRAQLAPQNKKWFIDYLLEEAGYSSTWRDTGWCGGGVFVCYQRVGILVGTGEDSNGFTPYNKRTATPFEFENWAKRKGVWHTNTPQPGDFFCSDENNKGETTHVGIIEYVANNGKELHTIEFNYSNELASYETRTDLSKIRGYATPLPSLSYLYPPSQS